MKFTNYITYVFFSMFLVGCSDEHDMRLHDFNPPLSGKIVGIEQFHQLEVFDISSKNSVYYGDAEHECRPIWSYDGSRFATYKFKQSSLLEDTIKIVDTQNNSITLWEIDNRKGDLTWSPDGNTIAYLGEGVGNINYLNIKTGNIKGSPLLLPDSLRVSAITWHPDGEKIVIITKVINAGWGRNNTYYIYMIDPYESDLTNLIPELSFDTEAHFGPEHLDWSLDGRMLLMSKLQDIYIFNVEEISVHSIPNIRGHSACWSKGGNYILFSDWRWVSMNEAVNDLHITDAEGSFDYVFYSNYESNLIDWY